jgi:hypothetical protein
VISKRERSALEREALFRRDWSIDSRNKVIARRGKGRLADRLDLLWWRRHRVDTLYRVLRQEHESGIEMSGPGTEATTLGRPIDQPVYRLCDGWRIPQDDLKYLRRGSLLSENGDLLMAAG